MIGDSQSQDKMCGRYLAYANVPRICCACDVTPEESDNPYHVCNFLSMYDMNKKCVYVMQLYYPKEYGIEAEVQSLDEDQLKQLKLDAHESLRMVSQHMHINAFNDVWFGPNTYGLLEKLPHDMMHAFLHGVLMYVIEVIMSPLNPTEKYCLDSIVDEIVVPICSSRKKDFPRCSFTHGITNLSLLTADERIGVTYVIALVGASKPGNVMLKKAAKRIKRARIRGEKVNEEVDENGNAIIDGDDDEVEVTEVFYADTLCEPENMLEMLEMLLAFHAWYKRGHPFSLKTITKKEEVMKAI